MASREKLEEVRRNRVGDFVNWSGGVLYQEFPLDITVLGEREVDPMFIEQDR
jgi:hypothetical protein